MFSSLLSRFFVLWSINKFKFSALSPILLTLKKKRMTRKERLQFSCLDDVTPMPFWWRPCLSCRLLTCWCYQGASPLLSSRVWTTQTVRLLPCQPDWLVDTEGLIESLPKKHKARRAYKLERIVKQTVVNLFCSIFFVIYL